MVWVSPASISTSTPLMLRARALAKYTIKSATSSARTMRPWGIPGIGARRLLYAA